MTNLAALNGVKPLNRTQQQTINGGNLGNPFLDPHDLPNHTDDDYKTKE